MKELLTNLTDRLFGCWHTNMSFPITMKPVERRSQAAWRTGTYVVCLDCGKEFAYDWKSMQIVSQDKWNRHAHSLGSRPA